MALMCGLCMTPMWLRLNPQLSVRVCLMVFPCHGAFAVHAQHVKQTDTRATQSVPSCRGFLHKAGQVGACCYPDKWAVANRGIAAPLPLLQEVTHNHVSTLR